MPGSVFAIADQDLRTDLIKNLKRYSDVGELKIYRWGNATITPDGDGDGFVDIPHDLNYAPSFFVYVQLLDGSWAPVGAASTLAYGDASAGIFGVSDSLKLRIQTIGGYSKLSTIARNFRYYLLVDKAEDFSGTTNIELTGDRGMKFSEDGINVFEGKEYQMKTSTKYKSLQYFRESIQTETLTLPLMRSSIQDQDNSEYQYVDFEHGLGYPPMFTAYFTTGSTLREIPYNEFIGGLGDDYLTQFYYTSYEVSGKVDDTKIRIEFRRRAIYDIYQMRVDGEGGSTGGSYSPTHSAQTITIKVVAFAENLEGLSYGE